MRRQEIGRMNEERVFNFLRQKKKWCISLKEIAEEIGINHNSLRGVLERLRDKKYINFGTNIHCCGNLKKTCIKVIRKKYNG